MAATVMAFAITTSITTMQRAFLAIDAARGVTYAGQIMQSELEKMRLLPFTTVSGYLTAGPSANGVDAPVTIDSSFTSNTYIGTRFTMTRTATTVSSRSGMIKVTLTITWKSYDGRSLSRSYLTYYGQNGLYDYYAS